MPDKSTELVLSQIKKNQVNQKFVTLVIILVTSVILLLTLHFTYLGLSWTGLRYNVNVQPDYLEISEPTSEPSPVFKDLETGDRIIALDGITISEIIHDEELAQNKLLMYPSQKGQKELTLAGSRISAQKVIGQEVLLWAIFAKNVTVDFSQRQGGPPSKLPANFQRVSSSQLPQSSNLAELSLNNLTYNSEKDALTLVLAITGLFFSLVGLFFFVIKPAHITLVYWLINQLICLELIISSLDRTYIGNLEKIFLIGAGGLLGPVYLHLMLLFPDAGALSRRAKVGLSICYALMAGLVTVRLYTVLLTLPNEVITSIENIVGKLTRLGLFITCCLGMIILLLKYFRSKGQRRLRIRLAVFAFAFGMIMPLVAVAYYLIASWWGPVIYDRFGLFLLPCVIVPPLIGYAVVKNKLFGLTTAVRYFTTYLLLTLLVIVSYFLLTITLVALLPIWKEFSADPVTIALFLSLLCVILYQFRSQMQRLVDRIFKFDPQDYGRLVQTWHYRLLRLNELTPILEEMIFNFPEEFHYDCISLILWHPSIKELLDYRNQLNEANNRIEGVIIFASPCASSITAADEQRQLNYQAFGLEVDYLKQLETAPDFLNQDLLKQISEQTNINFPMVKAQAGITLKLEEEGYGVLLLGEKISNYLPTDEERTHLVTLTRQLTMSLHNVARLVTEKVLKEMYKTSLNHQERVREQERLNFSGLIHDDLLQRLSATKLFLVQLRKELNSEVSKKSLNDLYGDVEIIIQSLRDVNSAIMPVQLHNRLISALKEFFYLKQLQYAQIQFDFIQAECDWYLLEQNLNMEQKINLYRFFEEATNNAIKHAEATEITALVTFCLSDIADGTQFTFQVEVSDNGKGVDSSQLQNQARLVQNKHFGIHTMQRRIELIGGQVEFISSVGEGTIAKASLSLTPQARNTAAVHEFLQSEVQQPI